MQYLKPDFSFRMFLFVIGNPGAGKSTFCKFFRECAAEREVAVEAYSDYQFLRRLYLSDVANGVLRRFENDATSEFVVRDLDVFEDVLECMRNEVVFPKMSSSTRRVLEFSLPRYDSSFTRCMFKGLANGVIVHIDTPLSECMARNEVRRSLLDQRLAREERGDVFGSDPDVHYVPPSVYERYRMADESLALQRSILSDIAPGAYFRLENAEGRLERYREESRVLIRNAILPLMAHTGLENF